jgi:hypothetical protein
MDEITLFAALKPAPPANAADLRQAARARLVAGFGQAPKRGRRRLVLAGSAALAAGAAILVPAVVPAGGGGSLVTAAWAVQRNSDGSVTILVKDSNDPAGLERVLRADGIRTLISSPPLKLTTEAGWTFSCLYPMTGSFYEPARVQKAVVTSQPPLGTYLRPYEVAAIIRPAAMPPGSVLFIVDTVVHFKGGDMVGNSYGPAVLKSDRLPPCVPTGPQGMPASP